MSHVRVFGCTAYSHIPDQLRKNLNDKTKKCIFVGYILETKGYKLYNTKTQKLIISRDVIFQEHGVWDWYEEQNGSLSILVFINNEVQTNNLVNDHFFIHYDSVMLEETINDNR